MQLLLPPLTVDPTTPQTKIPHRCMLAKLQPEDEIAQEIEMDKQPHQAGKADNE